MIVQFKDDMSFAFEFVRNLGFMYYGGSDLDEMIATSEKVKLGDPESWFTEWDALGRRILERANALFKNGVAEKIRTPCLVMDAEGDMFFKGQPQQVYDALNAPKLLYAFTAADGAENHCQSGELSFKDEVVFNWLDETLELHDGRRGWKSSGSNIP